MKRKKKKYYVAVLCRDLREFMEFERNQFFGIEILIPVYGWMPAERLMGLELASYIQLPNFEVTNNCSDPVSLLDFVKERIR